MNEISRAILGVLLGAQFVMSSQDIAAELTDAGYSVTSRHVTLCIRRELAGSLSGSSQEGWTLLPSARPWATGVAMPMPVPRTPTVPPPVSDDSTEAVHEELISTSGAEADCVEVKSGQVESVASAVLVILTMEAFLIVLGYWLRGLWLVAFLLVPLGFAMRDRRRYRYGGSGKAARRYVIEAPDSYDLAWGLISKIVIASGIALVVWAMVAAK